MLKEENIQKLGAGLSPFPNHVFVDDQAWLTDHLWPVLSIDLGVLRPELAGTVVHLLRPMGPIDGYIGDDTVDFHNDFAASNWFALHLTEDNRYRFLGQDGYFAPHSEKYAASVKKYQTQIREYAQEHGRMADFSSRSGKPREVDWLDTLGGDFWAGNWLTESPPPAFELDYDESDERIELSREGHPFFPVACADGFVTLMFYEPESRTVLFTFDES